MQPEHFYHIYNRGNNSQNIFFERKNYLFFLKKVRKHLLPEVDLLAYCLMPNHFHFLVYTRQGFERKKFSENLRVMLSSYTRAINKAYNRTGSLFQQNTKIKDLVETSGGTTPSRATTSQTTDPAFICFHYIHQNPWKAGLVRHMEKWEMSSFQDYAGLRNGSICNRELAHERLEVPLQSDEFIAQSMNVQCIDDLILL